jgi:hypothetical protein
MVGMSGMGKLTPHQLLSVRSTKRGISKEKTLIQQYELFLTVYIVDTGVIYASR